MRAESISPIKSINIDHAIQWFDIELQRKPHLNTELDPKLLEKSKQKNLALKTNEIGYYDYFIAMLKIEEKLNSDSELSFFAPFFFIIFSPILTVIDAEIQEKIENHENLTKNTVGIIKETISDAAQKNVNYYIFFKKCVSTFDAQKTIGSGSFSSVELVTHNNDRYIKKIIHEENCYLVETTIFQRIHNKHPNIIEIIAYGKDCIVLPYLERGNLAHQISTTPKPTSQEIIKQWMIQFLSALTFLHHQKIIHRDIKLENILLNENNQVKLIDFGLATTLPNNKDFLKSDELTGSIVFIPPESIQQSLNKPEQIYTYKPSFDCWAAGIVLWQLLVWELYLHTFEHHGAQAIYVEMAQALRTKQPEIAFPSPLRANRFAKLDGNAEEFKPLLRGLCVFDESKRLTAKEGHELLTKKAAEDSSENSDPCTLS